MLTIGNWSFDPASRALRRRGTERRLTPKASGVLQALAETPRQVWSRDALLERVWPDVIVGEEVLTHAIAELRTALGDHSRAPHFIETIHKSGYRLLCGATRVGATSGQVDSLSSADEAGLRLDAYGAYLDAETLLGRGGGGNARAALPLLSAALEAEPRFAPFRLAAARVRAYLAIYYAPDAAGLETALDQARIGLRLAPRSADALAVHGFVLAIGGDSTRALRAFRAALEAAPEQASILYLLGRAGLAEIGVASAAPILERAAALRGDDYHSLMLAGKARQIVGDIAGARRDFARALVRIETQDNPDDVRA
ncbi:MAG: winged helix-turn-helix domain-containing protein, partial [Allosphingosinicella sp.]